MNIPSLPILMKKLTAQKEKDLIKKIQIQFEAVKNITYTGEMLEGSTGIFDYYFEGTSSQGKKISLSIDDLGTITGHPFLPAHNNMKSLTVTPEHYRTLVDKVYHVDKLKADHRKLRKSHVFMTKDGQEWLVIKTIDANDSRNRKGYTDNGFQDMAVIPKTLEFPRGDASQTLIVYAGTNPLDEKDLRTDVLNIVLGEEKFSYRTKTGTLQTVDSQFTSAERFFEEVSALPQVSVLSTSGHSLGGALAQKVAAKHKIPAFTYSTAGVYPQLTDSEKEWLSGDGKEQVVNFIHEGDQVSSWTDAKKYGTALLCEEFSDKMLLSGHFLTSSHFDKEGHVKLLKKENPSKSKK